jgi:hypothetical protein
MEAPVLRPGLRHFAIPIRLEPARNSGLTRITRSPDFLSDHLHLATQYFMYHNCESELNHSIDWG